MTAPVIIIGTGLAGYQVAREFRKLNKDCPLTIITSDAGNFYPKPQISTALTKDKTPEALITASAKTMAEELHATIMTDTMVSAINANDKTITVKDQNLSYTKLVLAVGADIIKAPLKGDAIEDVISINNIYHYQNFKQALTNKKRVAILGAGLIGSEFANDLSNVDLDVHVIAPAKTPLDLLLPEEIGKILQNELEKNGVVFHLGSIANTVNKKGDKYTLELSDNTTLEADLILSAIGLVPHTDLAKTSGLKINRGVIVNEFLETSNSDIYAIGDCAEVLGHVLPYIAPILTCAKSLAKTLNGEKTAVKYSAMPVVVKTPAHPIVVCPPPKDAAGKWQIETVENSTKALFFNPENQLIGFVLTNKAVKNRALLVKDLPALF